MSTRRNIVALLAGLICANALAWGWALALFHARPLLLGTALLAWGLGLRHAVDADHIAAIDNVTRKLMQQGDRPVSTGLWFAVGHAAIVAIASVTVALTTRALTGIEGYRALGSIVATIVSALFLFAIGAMNLMILRSVWRRFRAVRAGTMPAAEQADLLTGGGVLARLFRPLLAMITRPWHMAPLGFLFGLGFDTATEVALLGLSAGQAADGLATGAILLFPALFAAGMALIDTLDGVIMLGAYEWARVDPLRKLAYNMTVTALSAVFAILIGGIETAAMLAGHFGLSGGAWDLATALGGQFNALGFALIALFLTCWGASFTIWRWKRPDPA